MGGAQSSSTTTGGLRVHRVYPNGPGETANIEVFFDYILEADNNAYTDDTDETLSNFTNYVSKKENEEITLNIFNARKRTTRLVKIVPKKWDGVGLLGISVKFSEFTAMDEGARVVNVYDDSPARAAGLIPFTDYLLGTNLQLFVDMDCVRVHVAEHVDEEIQLYVYNSITETLRKTTIVPKNDWGGTGALGCDLANGYIHKIPLVKAIWNYPNKEVVNDNKEAVETIDLSAIDSKTDGEAYLPPSIVDLRLASISLTEKEAANSERESDRKHEADKEKSSNDDGKEKSQKNSTNEITRGVQEINLEHMKGNQEETETDGETKIKEASDDKKDD
ncbi:bifunctional GRASP-type PDZ domain/PDZ superfamily/GRASP55-65 [Babesia duncani]|uniref:Bifunctional GRASP-type PDZ domain/PDZ superfamily/GRASP55-65 n=1 Tax=Babesia duncani TaxID=323732 RepID=A0AAD9PHU1_9APIC|nr:bifunctional GRASP-type PDZ domain/PDZ superfamily/GRASP55-65 [Babesia duncani]